MENKYERSSLQMLLLDTCANDYIQSLIYINNTEKYSIEEKVKLSKAKLDNYLKERFRLIQELLNMDILELRKCASLS